MQARTVFVISDGTGITAEILSHSLLTQFPGIEFHTEAIPYVDSMDKARAAVAQVEAASARDGVEPLVFVTFADDAIHDIVIKAPGVFLDVFDAFIGPLERALGAPSSHTRGQSHGVVDLERYTSRIGAIDYTMQADDGIDVVDYSSADLLLLGVSRSGKTPTCLYLALHFGLRVANYPLLEDDLDRGGLPARLEPWRGKLFGLTIDPLRLQQIRQERRANSHYSRLLRCRREVSAAEDLFRREQIPFVDVTAMSIEEISTTIMNRRGLHRAFI